MSRTPHLVHLLISAPPIAFVTFVPMTIFVMHSPSAFAAAKSVMRRTVSSSTTRCQHAGRCRGGLLQNNNGAQAACVAAGGTLTAFAFVQHRQFGHGSDKGGGDFPRPFGRRSGNMRISPVGPKAFAESPNNGRGDQDNDADKDPLKTAAGWVKEVKRDGLAKFLNETILGDVKGAVDDVVGNVTDVVENVTEAVDDVVENVTDVVEKVKATKEGKADAIKVAKDGEIVRTGSEGFASLTDLVSGIILGKSSSNEEAVRNLIDTARENVDVGDVDDSASLEELYALFRDLWVTLDKTFAGIDFSRFFELEDEKKNPSWKRMVHRYMKGVDVRMVNDLFDALQFAHLAYACKESDIRDGLESFNEKYELVYYDPDSKPGEPSHYLALKKGQSRWATTLDVILAVRGTDSVEDVLTDALGIPVEYRGGKAHDGFVRSGKRIVELHKPLLEEMLRMSGKKKIKLRIFGHSLGAATGTIANSVTMNALLLRLLALDVPLHSPKNFRKSTRALLRRS